MILDALPIMIVYVDMDQRCRFINQAYENWFGIRREDAIGNVAVMLAALGVFGSGQGWPDLVVAAIMGLLALSAARVVIRQARRELA